MMEDYREWKCIIVEFGESETRTRILGDGELVLRPIKGRTLDEIFSSPDRTLSDR